MAAAEQRALCDQRRRLVAVDDVGEDGDECTPSLVRADLGQRGGVVGLDLGWLQRPEGVEEAAQLC